MATKLERKKALPGKTLVNRVHQSRFADADARVLVAVADAGSFTDAANVLALTPSAVSKAVSRLEDALGVKLIARTTRSLHLTDEGLAFRERAARAFGDLDEAVDDVSRGAGALTGTIRLGLPPIFGTYLMPFVLRSVLVRHPKLRIEISSTMRLSDVIERRLDLAIAVGPLPDSRLIGRPLGEGRFVTIASPRYLADAGTPTTLGDLTRHRCLTYTQPDGREAMWLFSDGPRGVQGRASSDDMHHLGAMAREGLGVAQVPELLVAHELEAGTLVRILREHEPPAKPATLVLPPSRATTRRVRLFADEILAASPIPGTSAARSSQRQRTSPSVR